MPGWQAVYAELKDQNFEIISVAEDTAGVKVAGPIIEKAKPTYTVLIDPTHEVTRLYNMVNVPTAVWIDEQGRIVRPNETAYVDNRYTIMHKLEAKPYLDGLRDWVKNGSKSKWVLTDEQWKERTKPQSTDHAQAAAEFLLAEHLHRTGHAAEAVGHYKESQRLNPESWNFKRQAWALGNADKDYGTNWGKEVQKLKGKPYYPPRQEPPAEKKH